MNRLFIRIWLVNIIVVITVVACHVGLMTLLKHERDKRAERHYAVIHQLEKDFLFLAKNRGLSSALDYLAQQDYMKDRVAIYDVLGNSLIDPIIEQPLWYQDSGEKRYKVIHFYDVLDISYVFQVDETVDMPFWMSKSIFASFLRGAIFIILGGAISYFLSRHVTLPITHIASHVRRLGSGELDIQLGPSMVKRCDEIGELARDINHMASALLVTQSSQQRLLSDIAHELRSPLSRQKLALSFLENLIDNGENCAQQQVYIERAQIENNRLNDLIDEVLSYLRADYTTEEVFERLSLNHLLADIIMDAVFEFTVQNKSVKHNLLEPVYVYGVYFKLVRALENIIRNAFFHTYPNTQVEITLKIDNNEAVITVADQGDGVPEDEIPLLTKVFYRTDSSRNREKGGYGLGLSIGKAIIQAHGGKLYFANRQPRGLEVTIILPLAPAEINENDVDS